MPLPKFGEQKNPKPRNLWPFGHPGQIFPGFLTKSPGPSAAQFLTLLHLQEILQICLHHQPGQLPEGHLGLPAQVFFGFAVENLNLKTLHHMMSTQVKGNGHFRPPIRVEILIIIRYRVSTKGRALVLEE